MTQEFMQRHPRLTELFGIDLRSLALFRAVLGSVVLIVLLRHYCDLTAFYSDYGVTPRAWIIDSDSYNRISLYFLNGSTWFAALLLTVQCVFALMFTLGWHTRLASIVTFFLWGSLMNRAPIVLIGGDILACCLLFWGMFLPLGARWSVDAALAQNPPPRENQHVSWASAALLLQVVSVYFFSAMLKNGAEWYPDFTGVYYALSLDRYATPLGLWLLNFPQLLKGLSFYVFWLEAFGPLLVFIPFFNRPVRFLMMLCFATMHIGFLLCLELGHFPYVSISSHTVLLGGWFWDWMSRRHQQKDPGTLRIYYDRDCGFCQKTVLLMQQFLVLPRAQVAPAQDTPRAKTLLEANYSWVVIDTDDQAYLKWPAFVVLIKHSPLFGWLWRAARLPAFERPGNAVYDFVGRNRGGFASVSAWLLPMREVRWEPNWYWRQLAGVFLVAVFIWNWCTVERSLQRYFGPTPALQRVADRTIDALGLPFRMLRIDQLWNMFAPFPLKEDGWMVIPATLADGSEIDLMHPERKTIDYSKPYHLSQLHENIRWNTYRGRLYENDYTQYRLYYGKYLCRTWNRDKLEQNQDKRLMTFKLVYMVERTPPPGEPTQVEQQTLWKHECFPSASTPPAK
ncbi:MAG TPA: DCC1-like thiol-disulfide oxidoreductase family protein [Nevskiaceae bacterium]|nr:DCC1-like thiol-disulfide oxidoreductase family protein [Nevskiaceae bacterium]